MKGGVYLCIFDIFVKDNYMNKCKKCNREFKNLAGVAIHEKFCDGFGSKNNKKTNI